jgi:hypothetical protein
VELGILVYLLWHPIGMTVLAVVVLLSTAILYLGRTAPSPISLKRLAFGYLGATIVCLGIAAVNSYIPPEQALSHWKVPSARYWEAVLSQFALIATFMTYIATLGIAIVGAPVILAMARRGYGSVPWVLFASLLISLIATFLLVRFSQPSGAAFGRVAPVIVGPHLLLALGFSVGAGLPWRRRTAGLKTLEGGPAGSN